jgi:hypothetical protein
VIADLYHPEDVARWLASNPTEDEHERALDSLADAHGNLKAVVVWRHGVRLHEQGVTS